MPKKQFVMIHYDNTWWNIYTNIYGYTSINSDLHKIILNYIYKPKYYEKELLTKTRNIRHVLNIFEHKFLWAMRNRIIYQNNTWYIL